VPVLASGSVTVTGCSGSAGTGWATGRLISRDEASAGSATAKTSTDSRPLATTAVLIGQLTSSPPPAIDQELLRRFDSLTARERAVIVLVAGGLRHDEIAAQMVVSLFTVKTPAVRATTKVGARGRAQLVSFTFRAGPYP
jgi:DNA-binding NarL/FixJ family response regulator